MMNRRPVDFFNGRNRLCVVDTIIERTALIGEVIFIFTFNGSFQPNFVILTNF